MIKKAYYLSTCDTCKRIIKELGIAEEFEYQDIKADKITKAELEEMRQLAGSYEALFSRTARKYKELGLKDKPLTEDDYKGYILEEYTFLKRPVFVVEDRVFVGNSKRTVEELKGYLNS